jgi:DNA polymerase-1
MIWLGVDGTNLIHALWHAMGSHRTVDGILAAFGKRIEALADPDNEIQPSVVLVCFDRRSFRHGILAGYKGNRPAKDDDLQRALELAPAAIADRWQPVYQDGYEADDLLATLATAAVASGHKCVICSPDKDLWQCLVPGRVSILRRFETSAGEITSQEWFTHANLEAWPKNTPYGLKAWQWAEFQALVGESGDNVPGCPGWGEKTAGRALANAGDLAAMLRDPWAVKCTSKQLVQLQNWAKSPSGMRVVMDCVRLRTDVAAIKDALA